MSFENIVFQVDQGIATITFNRPKALNALNQALLAELSQALDAIAADESVRVLILTGAGEKAFVAGADIGELATFSALHAADTAKFGLPEITLGLIPGFGGTQRLPRLIGANRAKELIFTGKMISAAEAAQIGLANKVVPAAALMEEALKTARDIAAKGRVSLRAVKQAINQGLNVDLVSGCNIEVDAFALALASPDAKEGTAAFLEKRKAVFKGSLKD
jgi:enoyl-CoA hydratase